MERREIGKRVKRYSITPTQRTLGKFWDSVETGALIVMLVIIMSLLFGSIINYILT